MNVDTVRGSFESLLAAHDKATVQSVVWLLENNAKWTHSLLSELRLPDGLRVQILALRDRLHAKTSEPVPAAAVWPPVCAKCRGTDIALRYVWDDYENAHMAAKCRRCDYVWRLPCADSPTAEPEPPTA